ncbi:MAG: segregation/condensation protein A [Candidatus Omnitrophica bacterium]|nr:segregation/condensation protein A [Candidatus Omnitrophota bacterium]MDE2009950.1 segregation/condensation protein A [Candidatus Omnitrophota bacterium]MDE2213928.1 segregation/condensation protein A [Candidatus Omnitrophota bacterium]MDE2231922.1 segregation/condensation protein A [Candidatus Omnitrophota bacterium]
MNYKIHLEKFEGPLDLLLYLIKKNDIDICDIPIATVTDQYMEYIEMMKMLDLDVVGDFLVMAATLMQIKSRMLLPPDPLAGPETADPRQELVDRLKEYEQFKLVAGELKHKELFRQNLFTRLVDEESLDAIKEDAQEVLVEATLFDLITALSEALKQVPEKKDYQITREVFSVEGKIHELLHLLVENQRLSLMDLFRRARSKDEIVCTFVAVLELTRQKEITVVQHRHFEDIEIVRNAVNEKPAGDHA